MPSPLDFSLAADRRRWSRELLGPLDEAKWDALVRTLFAWQHARVPAFARLCTAHGVAPGKLLSWRDLPAMPQQVFKRQQLYARGLPKPDAVYETSGTTTGQPGRQHLFRADLYREVAVAGARHAGLFREPVDLHLLAPATATAPHSSLSAMFGFWAQTFAPRRARFWLKHGRIDFAALRRELLAATKAKRPVALCGAAFAFVHLIDAWADLPTLRLPRGSWLLETGGFKGRSREVDKADLYAALGRTVGVRDDDIWNEYGMSELSSQAYARGTEGRHAVPPWARVVVVNPASGREVRVGQTGLVRWLDLANVDSVFALQTLDLAERTADGFRLLGRMPRTEPRGCSLSVEDLRP
jgi:hypothetical protein